MIRSFKTKQTWQPLIAMIFFISGSLLMIYMIFVEDEPGAVPLFLIIVGLAWITRIRHSKKNQITGCHL